MPSPQREAAYRSIPKRCICIYPHQEYVGDELSRSFLPACKIAFEKNSLYIKDPHLMLENEIIFFASFPLLLLKNFFCIHLIEKH